jgi:alcohol dehydrogenase (cytochrome c)
MVVRTRSVRAFLLRGGLLAAALACLPAGTRAQNNAAPAAARNPEPNNVLAANQDAVFDQIMAGRSAKLAKLSPVTDALLDQAPDGDWLTWRRTWANEITPVVHDGVIFIDSGNTIKAIDAVSGDTLWQYVRQLPAALNNGRTAIVKNIAIYQDKIYAPTPDGHVVALDAKTGKLVWDTGVLGPKEAALRLDGGPIVAHGKVIMGASGCNTYAGGCFIFGLDAQTGAEAWRFHTLAQPGQPGGDSWNGAPVQERYGGGVWTSGSYDPERNLLFFGVGNTYDAGTLLLPQPRKGDSNDGLYTDSTLALDPDTGKLVWYFQHMNRDVWDMDWVFEQTLVTLPVDGKPRDLVVTGGKIAIFDAVDRATGQYVFSKDLGLQNLVSAIDPKTGHKAINPALEPESGKAKLLCPSSSGARSWPTTAFNPRTNILYVPMIESCSNYTWNARGPAEVAAGGSDMQFPPTPRPGADGNFGRLEAINLQTKKVVWTLRQRAPVASSMLATAGGLVFNGSLDRRFHAYDEMTGKLLWQVRLNASPSSSPVTYSVGGRQYVAVVTGGGGSFDAAGRGLTPEIDNPTGGTTVVAFKLSDLPTRR